MKKKVYLGVINKMTRNKYQKKYDQTEKGKTRYRKYQLSEKGYAAQKKYRESEKGKAAIKRGREKQRLKKEGKWIE